MAQRPRRYPFKMLEMTVTRIHDYKFEYAVYENGKQISSRINSSGSFAACFIMKGIGRHPYSICHLFKRVDLIGNHKPNANPYAVGLISGVEITGQDIYENPRILKYFLRNSLAITRK